VIRLYIKQVGSLLAGVYQYAVHRLQRVMNAAARMLCGAGKYCHVSGLIRERLHSPLVVYTTAPSLLTVFDNVQSDTRTGATILI